MSDKKTPNSLDELVSMPVVKVNHGKAFGNKDWFTYYCGSCKKQLDSTHMRKPCSCGVVAVWNANV